MQNSHHMVLKGVHRVHNDKIRSNGLERNQLGKLIKLGQMVLKGVNWVHNNKMRLNGLERSKLGTLCKNQVIWS